jgi:competence protein ComEC
LFGAALGFCGGVGIYYLLPELPPPWLFPAVCAAWLVAALRLRAALPIAAFAAGLCWAQVNNCKLLCDPFPETLVGQTVLIEGSIASLPVQTDQSVRFLFRVDRLRADGTLVPFRGLVRLSWYRQAPPLLAGQRWQLAVRLKPPHGFVNPGGFDYERWLFQQGISATGHVRDVDGAQLLDQGPVSDRLTRLRQRLRDRLDAVSEVGAPESAAGALVQALVLGERGALRPAQWEVFSRTGTSHLIAISGLHVGLVAGFAFFLGRWLWSRSARLIRVLAAPRAGALAALAAAVGYAALAGFAISTQRALVMLAVLLLALVAGRTLRPMSGLVLALAAVLLVDPNSVLSYGFWLSFGAVAVLLYALGRRLAPARAVLRWGRAQWAVAVGLLPMLLLFFGRASLVAPLVNLIAVPLFGLLLPLVLLGALAALVSGWQWPLAPALWFLDHGYRLLAWVADWPLAAMTLGGRSFLVWTLAFAGASLLLAPRGLPARWLGLVLLLPLAVARPPAPAPGDAHLTLLDVGQGLSVVVRTAHHALVYDLGPRYPSGFETGSAVVVPYLREVGVQRLDRVIISHADRDHSGGLHGLLDAMPVDRLFSGEPSALAKPGQSDLGRSSHLVAEHCHSGQRWHWDGVDFEILHPHHRPNHRPNHRPGDGLADGQWTGNDASCVLRIASGGASALLTGDIGSAVESRLVQTLGARLAADVLVAAHHGSTTSSSAAFLQAVDPDWVLYSSGFANRFGFPAAEVHARVTALGARTANTADSGALRLVLPAAGPVQAPVRWRAADARIWRHRPRPHPLPEPTPLM